MSDGFYGNFPSQQGNSSTDPRVFEPVQLSAASLASLPTSDPKVVGQPWNDNGILTISKG